MKIITFFISTFIFCQLCVGQEEGKNLSVDAQFNWLLHYKRTYEEFQQKAQKNSSYVTKRDSMYTVYTNKIESIRNAPEIYLSHIDRAITKNKVDYDGPARVLYSYVNTAMPFDPDLHFINRLDLYKIIKKHIFEKKELILPEKTAAYIKAGGDNSTYKVINR